jgi:DNA polymerase I-like protein with 3'-5' exonuclease and polymerase domains
MGEAYEREKKLMPILQRAERHGIRVDMERLHKDLYGDGKGWIGYEQVAINVDNEIRTLLGNPNVNIDSGDEFADAVEAAGFAGTWALTPTGRRSTAKGVIEQGIAHPRLVALFRYRQALSTCLSTFMRPWYRMAQATGRMYPNWNQVKNNRNEKDQSGTKTGRLSCNDPNFQNPSNEFTIAIPDPYPALPLVRVYILPDVGCVWLKRDYSQQELRVLAHFAEGDMLQKYQTAPRTDFHSLAAEMIQQTTGIKMTRKIVKIIAFSILYGSGAASMAEQMGCSVAEAQDLKNIYMATFPGIKTLSDELKGRGRRGDYMRTWGGRVYYSEPAVLSKKSGRMQEYHYKLLNYLIQGSSADCTKEAVIAYDTMYRKEGTFLLTVHDELDICAPVEAAEEEMRRLDKAMQYPGFDVPMLSDGFIGPNWFELKEYHV